MELAIVGVAVRQTPDSRMAVAFASMAPTPVRARETEAAFTQGGIEGALTAALDQVAPIDDMRASRGYRLHLVQVLLRWALTTSWPPAASPVWSKGRPVPGAAWVSLNGQEIEVALRGASTLLDALRDDLGLTGMKRGARSANAEPASCS